jgi:hypothetical protein
MAIKLTFIESLFVGYLGVCYTIMCDYRVYNTMYVCVYT